MSIEKQIINLIQFESPLGTLVACASEKGICLLEFNDRRMLPTEFKIIEKSLNATIDNSPLERGQKSVSTNSFFEILQQQLNEYFDGKRKEFTVPLHPIGTAFQQSVWKELLNIPYGKTRSYKQQALALKNLPAIRAVAGANGMNKIAIIIPCHRVIGEDGSLVGYGGKLWRKKWLLDLETRNVDFEPGSVVQKSLFEV
jgi:AraC family transcriptional regulator, regulatory protein of adaptative response / methylated-DNA-[protein]-cysteine methyltransferase